MKWTTERELLNSLIMNKRNMYKQCSILFSKLFVKYMCRQKMEIVD